MLTDYLHGRLLDLLEARVHVKFTSGPLMFHLCSPIILIPGSKINRYQLNIHFILPDAEIGQVLPVAVQAATKESLETCVVDHQQKKLVNSVISKL